jgi:hypothetical protein
VPRLQQIVQPDIIITFLHHCIQRLCRTYTVLNVAHRASRTFVSKSIALTPVEAATLLANAHSHRGDYPASLSVSFRVTTLRSAKDSRKPAGSAPSVDAGTSEHGAAGGKRPVGRYRITVLYAVEGVVVRPSMNYHLVRNRFVPNLVAVLKSLPGSVI